VTERTKPPGTLRRRVLVLVLSALGISLCVWLVTRVGAEALAEGAAVVLPWLPVLLVLELGRTFAELLSTMIVLGEERKLVSIRRLVLSQFVSSVLNTVMPAGRASGEGVKAALLAPSLGLGRALAVGAAGQAIALLANAAFAIAGALFGLSLANRPVVLTALAIYAFVTTSGAVFMVVAARTGSAGRWIVRWPRVQASLQHFDKIVRRGPSVLLAAVSAQALARLLQALQLALLLGLCGGIVSLASVAFAQALQLVGAAAGDLVPAQVGATDGAFVLAARGLGLSPTKALVVSLSLHAVQLLGAALIAAAAFVLWWREDRARRGAVHDSGHDPGGSAAELPKA
jgi:hypothetical protein